MSQKDTKQNQLREVAPHIWDMYRLLIEGRVINHENRLNFFLAVDALFIVGYLTLFEKFVGTFSVWYVIPFLFLFFPAVALLVDFMTRRIDVPWFEEDKLIGVIDKNGFHVNWILQIYVFALMTWEFQNRAQELLKWCFRSVIFALTWLLLLYILNMCDAPLSGAERMTILVLICLGIISVVNVAWTNSKEYQVHAWNKQVSDKLQSWLNKDESKGTDKEDN